MWLRNPLNDVLSSRAKVAILRVVCEANAPLHGREIARRCGGAYGHISRTLRELVASGVLRSQDRGRAITYELASPDSALIRHLRALFVAEAARYERALSLLTQGIPELVSVFLFGSEARGEARSDSDTDLLIVVSERTEAVEATLRENHLRAAEECVLALSWEVADLATLAAWDRSGYPLWQSIMSDGIRLRGKSLQRLRRLWQPGATD